MTKADLFAGPVRRHHVADLHFAVGDDHSVDQDLDQGPPLFERRLGQALPHPAAEILNRYGKPSELLSPVRLRFKLSRLPLELALALLEGAPAPPVFVQPHDPGEIGLGQPLELLPQARLSTA
jgi:hypothetical protein